MSDFEWISVTKRLPDNLDEVIITWENMSPLSYKCDRLTGVAVFYNNRWYWYTRFTREALKEYGRFRDMLINDSIEIIAWMPLPESYKKGD